MGIAYNAIPKYNMSRNQSVPFMQVLSINVVILDPMSCLESIRL